MLSDLQKNIRKNGGLFQRGSIDTAFFTFLVLIVVTGLIMLYSSTYAYAYYYYESSTYFFGRQVVWALIGFVLMLVVSRLDIEAIKAPVAHLSTLGSWALLCIALLMPAHNGTHRHIYIGSMQFQPSDVAKLALILTLAYWLDKYHNVVLSKKPLQGNLSKMINERVGKPVMNDSVKIIVLLGVIILIYAVLVIAGKHLSGTILILSIGIIMLYLGEIRGKWFAFGGAALGAVGFIAWKSGLLADYMAERIEAWVNKDFDPLGVRWQTNQALYAIGSGGIFGKGLGQSTLKHMYVSEPQNDMIFSIVVEELGFIGAAAIIILFALLIWRGVVIGINSPTRYGALVSMGIVFLLGVQVILNIAVATDSVPNTGISLPFFSYGGTALVMNMVEMGFVLNVSRSSRIRRR